VCFAAPASSKAPDVPKRELAAVEAGKVVKIERRKLSALATFKAGGDFQRFNFGEAIAIEVAMSEYARVSPCPLPARRANRSPDSYEEVRSNS
jgi:hypothetical protein